MNTIIDELKQQLSHTTAHYIDFFALAETIIEKIKEDIYLAELRKTPIFICKLIVESWDGEAFAASNEYGTFAYILADSFEDAYDALLDNMDTIDEKDLHEAYGFDCPEEFERAREEYDPEVDDIELSEGYRYQPNASGTGIVYEGYYLRLNKCTLANMCDYYFATV